MGNVLNKYTSEHCFNYILQPTISSMLLKLINTNYLDIFTFVFKPQVFRNLTFYSQHLISMLTDHISDAQYHYVSNGYCSS